MTTTTRNLTGKASLVYVGLGLGQRAIAFLLIPFLTGALTPAEYGEVAALTALSTLLSVLFGLSLEVSVLRRAVLHSGASPSDIDRASAQYLRVGVPVFALAGSAVILLLGVSTLGAPSWALASSVAAAGFQIPISSYALPMLRGEERLRAFTAMAVIAIGAQAGLTIGLVVAAGLGFKGWAIVNVGAPFVAYVASGLIRPNSVVGRVSWRHLKEPLRFTLPLLPHQVLTWLLAFVDRVIIIEILGAAEAGRYSLAYQASTVLGLAVTELNRSLMPDYTRLDPAAPPDGLRKIVQRQMAVMVVLSGLAIVAVPIIRPVLFKGEYASAWVYVAPLLATQLFYGLYFIPTNIITLTRGQSRRMWSASGLGASTNIVLNLALLHPFGLWGAVAANGIAYAAMALAAYRLEHAAGALLHSVVRHGGIIFLLLAAVVITVLSLAPAFGQFWLDVGSYLACGAICLSAAGLEWLEPRRGHGTHRRAR